MDKRAWGGLLFVAALAGTACGSSISESTTGAGGAGATTGAGGAGTTTTVTTTSTVTATSTGVTTSTSVTTSTGAAGGSPGCPALTVGAIAWDEYYQLLLGHPTPPLAGSPPELVTVELYETMPIAGTFDLGAGNDANYSTCKHCVLLAEDVNPMGIPKKFYFQTGGTMTITATDPATPAKSNGSIDGVTVVEVTIDPTTYASTPVPGGGCYTLPSGTWSNYP
jgi:hypothetical protein